MTRITQDTRLGEMMKKHPGTVDVLKSYRLDCPGCMCAEKESIRNVSFSYGIDLVKFLKDLNGAARK